MSQGYSTIAPRGQMQQQPVQQPQQYAQYPNNGYPQPNGYYQQPQYQQPAQAPAPNGYFVPHQAMEGMDGSQEFMTAYKKNLDAYNEANRKIKAGINESEAVKRVKEMSSYKTEVEEGWKDSVIGAAINTDQMINYINNLCVSLENPQEWMPEFRANYVERMRERSKNLVETLRNWAETIKKLAIKPEPSSGKAEGQ